MGKDSGLRAETDHNLPAVLELSSKPHYGQLREADRMREKGKKTANSIGGN